MTFLGLYDSLHPAPEADTGPPDGVHRKAVPHLHDVGLEGLHILVGCGFDIPLNCAPSKKIQGVDVGGVGGPDVLGLGHGHVVRAELLVPEGGDIRVYLSGSTHSCPGGSSS